ncbi:hypothetical protein F350042L8_23670 [Fusobacterium ulcerans]|uniref:hypothetical protein n=1 Tax=Fusobacterium ulcerans TaxID=861 RepID=UPI0034AB5BF6
MKKLLLVAGLLVVAGSAFAADIQTEASGEVEIFAQVLTDLNIETEPLNFGILGLNDNKTVNPSQTEAGKFIIKGASNTNISLTIEDTVDPENKFKNGQIVAKLLREGGSNGAAHNDRLVPVIKIYDKGTQLSDSDLSFNIADHSNLHEVKPKEFKVAGDITTRKEQNTGSYKGAIKVTAKYDSWPEVK